MQFMRNGTQFMGGSSLMLANWNAKQVAVDTTIATGLVFQIDFNYAGVGKMFLYEKKGSSSTTLWQSQTATYNPDHNTDYYPFGYWDRNFVTFTLARSGNQVQISSRGNYFSFSDFTSDWMITTIPNTGFAGTEYDYGFSELAAFDNFALIPEPSLVVLALTGIGLVVIRRRQSG
jgi:hypothetical protein